MGTWGCKNMGTWGDMGAWGHGGMGYGHIGGHEGGTGHRDVRGHRTQGCGHMRTTWGTGTWGHAATFPTPGTSRLRRHLMSPTSPHPISPHPPPRPPHPSQLNKVFVTAGAAPCLSPDTVGTGVGWGHSDPDGDMATRDTGLWGHQQGHRRGGGRTQGGSPQVSPWPWRTCPRGAGTDPAATSRWGYKRPAGFGPASAAMAPSPVLALLLTLLCATPGREPRNPSLGAPPKLGAPHAKAGCTMESWVRPQIWVFVPYSWVPPPNCVPPSPPSWVPLQSWVPP